MSKIRTYPNNVDDCIEEIKILEEINSELESNLSRCKRELEECRKVKEALADKVEWYEECCEDVTMDFDTWMNRP